MTQICFVCKFPKSCDEFYQNKKKRGGRDRTCKSCRQLRNEQCRLIREYGITLDDYQRILAEQGGGCAVCKKKIETDAGKTKLSIDHDHMTGLIRGILCGQCNKAIGQFNDDPEYLLKAVAYLKNTVYKTNEYEALFSINSHRQTILSSKAI